MRIDVYLHIEPDPEVTGRLDAIYRKLDLVLRTERRMENTMALDFAKMNSAIADQTTVDNSVLQYSIDMSAKVSDISAQLAAAIAANDPAAQAAAQTQLDALAQGILDNNAKVVAAIKAPGVPGTPAPVTP